MSVGMKTMRVGLGFPTLMVFILYCIDLTSFFYNFASRSPILMIFTFLKMALKFICSSSLLEECGSKNKGATDEFISNVNFRDKREIIVIWFCKLQQ